jgi:hypothetical protein
MVEPLEARDLPAPLTWAAGVRLPTPRGGVVAVMQGGQVLVLGGPTTDTPGLTVTDPTWQATVTAAPAQDIARSSPGVGITPSGGVLLFGGQNQGVALDSAYPYGWTGDGDPPEIPPLGTPRGLLGWATDENHRIYAIGGVDDHNTPLASVEYYTQATNSWTAAASLPQTLYAESAVADGAGHLFTFGGVTAGGLTSTVYRYTIATNTWDTVAPLPFAVRDSAAVLASNGLVYVLGGVTADGTTAAVESYNEATNTWTTEASLPAPVSAAAAVSDYLGRIEVLGGYDSNGQATANVWISQELNQADTGPTITTTAPTFGWTGRPYGYQVLSTANPQATYTLTAAPDGMTINPATGLIAWTPTADQVGSFPVTVQASNFAGQASQSFTLTVRQSPPTVPTNVAVSGRSVASLTLSWSPSTDPIGVTGYDVYLVTQRGHSGRDGGITTYYTRVATVTGTTATVGGLGAGGTYTFAVDAFDSSNLYSGYSLWVRGTTETLPSFTGQPGGTMFNLTARHAFSLTLTATGDPTDFSYTIINPPTGMTVGTTSGVVSWTPPDAAVGTTSVTFQVSSSAGTGGTITYNFAVAPNLPLPQYTSANLVNGTLYAVPRQPLTIQLSDSFSNSTVIWSLVSGPSGMAVNAGTGLVTWTPAATTPLGATSAVFQATNYAGSVNLTVPISVVFASAPTKVADSGLLAGPIGVRVIISWAAPTTAAKPVTKYEVLVTTPGGTGRTTTTYTVSGTARKLKVTGLPSYSWITVEVVAVDAKGDLGVPGLVGFVSP